jgi:hypothetical protein
MPLPGLSITPDAAQQTFGTVVIVHLTRPITDVPSGDANLMPDRLEKQRLDRLNDASEAGADVEDKLKVSF